MDVDLRGSAIYKTVETLREIQENGGFEFLSQGYSDRQGNYFFEFYSFQFAKAERLKADAVVYAVDKSGNIIGRSQMLHTDDYSAVD